MHIGLGNPHILQVCCGFLASRALHSVRSDKPAVENIQFVITGGLRRCCSGSEILTYCKYAAALLPGGRYGKGWIPVAGTHPSNIEHKLIVL